MTAIKEFIVARRELAVVVILGTVTILSVLFLIACIRSMIPVDGIHDWAGVRVGHDFITFYSGALLAVGGAAASAYDPDVLSALQQEVLGVEPENLPWRYPPIFFFFLLPFTLLSYLGAFWTWSAITIIALMVVVRQMTTVWYAPLLVPLCLPVAYTVAAGQNGNLSAILLGAGLVMLPRYAPVAGIVFGLLAYKPQLAVVLPFCLLAGRYYGAFISMAVTVVVLIMMSGLVFGIESWVAFFGGLLSQSDSAFSTTLDIWERIPTVMITVMQLFDSSRVAGIIQVITAVLAITLAAWVWRTSIRPGPLSLALVASIPLVSPYVWDYDMAILIIPIAFIAHDACGGKWTTGKLLLLLSMWVSEPMLRIISGKIGLQLGPVFWIVLLCYSVLLAKQERGMSRQQDHGE